MRKTGSECLSDLPKVTQQGCGMFCFRDELILFYFILVFTYLFNTYYQRTHSSTSRVWMGPVARGKARV